MQQDANLEKLMIFPKFLFMHKRFFQEYLFSCILSFQKQSKAGKFFLIYSLRFINSKLRNQTFERQRN